jgi:hypothetical protein
VATELHGRVTANIVRTEVLRRASVLAAADVIPPNASQIFQAAFCVPPISRQLMCFPSHSEHIKGHRIR